MALGAVGMIAFWALVGTGLMESINAIRIPNDRLLQAVGVFCACGIVAELVFAYADLQLMNPAQHGYLWHPARDRQRRPQACRPEARRRFPGGGAG